MCARAFVPLPRYAILDVHLHDFRNPAGHVMSNSPYQLRAGHPLLRFSHLLLRRRGPCIVAQCRADAHGAGAQHSQGPHLATVRSPSLSRVHQPPGGLRSALVSLRARRCRLSSLLSDGTLPLPTPAGPLLLRKIEDIIRFSTSAMGQILAREPKMAISGPFPGIFRRKNPGKSGLL